jgi:hypothetical protein
MCNSRPVTLTVGFKPVRRIARRGERHDPKLKPKIQGDYCTWNGCLYFVFNLNYAFEQFKRWDAKPIAPALFAQIQFVDQCFVTIGFCFAQIIEQTPALRDHLKQAAARRVIFSVGLKVLSQMLDPVGEKCDLHIRTAGIFLMQLELLKIQRLVALCHNEGANVDEDRVFATHTPEATPRGTCVIRMPHTSRVCLRTRGAVSPASEPCDARPGSRQRGHQKFVWLSTCGASGRM